MRVLSGLLIASLLSGNALACTVEEAASRIVLLETQNAADRAKQRVVITDGMRRLNAADAAAEMGVLAQRQSLIASHDRIEADRAREARAIREIFETANAAYLGHREPDKDAPEFQRWSALLDLRWMDAQKEFHNSQGLVSPEPKADCTLEAAIHAIERDSLDTLTRLDVGKDLAELNALAARSARTPDGKIERNLLRYADRVALEKLERRLAPAYREQVFIVDLENLKGLARMAELKYQLQKRDIDAGGDIKAGLSMHSQKLDARSSYFLQFLNKFADDALSTWPGNMQAMAEAVRNAQAQAPGPVSVPLPRAAPRRAQPAAAVPRISGRDATLTRPEPVR